MRENRSSGSEGGETGKLVFPTPIAPDLDHPAEGLVVSVYDREVAGDGPGALTPPTDARTVLGMAASCRLNAALSTKK